MHAFPSLLLDSLAGAAGAEATLRGVIDGARPAGAARAAPGFAPCGAPIGLSWSKFEDAGGRVDIFGIHKKNLL